MEQLDGIRLREFRQVRKEIRGSVHHLIVGIDVAKERHNAFFGTASGRTLHKRLIFDNTIAGFWKLLALTEALKVLNDLAKVVFGVEPIANYHKPLAEHLFKCGQLVVLVSATAVKNNRQLLDSRWDKHDTKDAANVARRRAGGRRQHRAGCREEGADDADARAGGADAQPGGPGGVPGRLRELRRHLDRLRRRREDHPRDRDLPRHPDRAR